MHTPWRPALSPPIPSRSFLDNSWQPQAWRASPAAPLQPGLRSSRSCPQFADPHVAGISRVAQARVPGRAGPQSNGTSSRRREGAAGTSHFAANVTGTSFHLARLFALFFSPSPYFPRAYTIQLRVSVEHTERTKKNMSKPIIKVISKYFHSVQKRQILMISLPPPPFSGLVAAIYFPCSSLDFDREGGACGLALGLA